MDDAKEGIQRIVSRPYKAQSDADGHEHQCVLIAALTHDEAVFPMTLEGGHEHGAEDPGGAQGRQEPKRNGEAAAHFPQNDKADPQPYRFEALFLEPLPQPGETRASEPTKELLRAVDDQRQANHQTEHEERYTQGDSHESCSSQ